MTNLVWSGATSVHTQFSYDNLFRRSNVVITGTNLTNINYLYDWNLVRRYAAGGDFTVTLTFPEAISCNHLWITGHNLGTEGAGITGTYGGASSLFPQMNPSNDDMLWIDFDRQITTSLTITISGSIAPLIGQMFIGETLDSERGIVASWTPPDFGLGNDSIVFENTGGYPLGRILRNTPQDGPLKINDFTHEWARDNLVPFRNHAAVYPFGLRWSTLYPSEVAFAWCAGKPGPITYQNTVLTGISWPIKMLKK